MILLELIEWTYEHWGEVSISALLLFVLRKFVMSEVQKMLHFGRDEELEWTRRKVEELTGEKWNGPQPILKHIRIRYFKRYYSSLRKVTKLELHIKERKKMSNINKALLGPLVATILLIIKTATGYEVPVVWADMGVDFFLSVYTIYGFFLHPTGAPISGFINKSLIMPIFATLGLIFSLITHRTISNDLVSALTDFVVYGVTLWGQFMHPVKEVTSNVQVSKYTTNDGPAV